MQDTNQVICTLTSRLREILKIFRVVIREQVLEDRHQLNFGNFRPLLLQNSNPRIYKWLEIWCDRDVLASCFVNEVGDAGSGISGRNGEGDAFCADYSEHSRAVSDCV